MYHVNRRTSAGTPWYCYFSHSEIHSCCKCIGATTHDEYRKHIEKDAVLERRFGPVKIPEPTVDETIGILRGLRERYEKHHQVQYADEALGAAAELSHKYIRLVGWLLLSHFSPYLSKQAPS